ncbi:hypothetical protein EVAR_75553_1 [Eumeta japonica]|uniref:Uncharacterized protein n=1 Tax=Eumeta variegata TaxID=151549 RepID=A0A4C1UIW8_EUMVA|nr:hypothetical protein EVAR_75553_1 [Eumeta japonica]
MCHAANTFGESPDELHIKYVSRKDRSVHSWCCSGPGTVPDVRPGTLLILIPDHVRFRPRFKRSVSPDNSEHRLDVRNTQTMLVSPIADRRK